MRQYCFNGHVLELTDLEDVTRRCENAEARLRLAKDVLVKDGYFREDEVNDDIAPRIGELCSHMRQRLDEGMPATLLEALDQLREQVKAIAERVPDVEAPVYVELLARMSRAGGQELSRLGGESAAAFQAGHVSGEQLELLQGAWAKRLMQLQAPEDDDV